MEKTVDQKKLSEIGEEIKIRLTNHFKQWEAGLPFKLIMSAQSHKAKQLGLDVGALANELENQGFIKILNSPSGARFVFAGDCPLSLEEMKEWLQTEEMSKETARELKRQQRI